MGGITFRIAMYHKATKWFCGSRITIEGVDSYLNVPPNRYDVFEDFFYEDQFLVLDYMLNKLVKELPMEIQIKGAVFEDGKLIEQIAIKRSKHGDKYQIYNSSGKLVEERDLNDNLERATGKGKEAIVSGDVPGTNEKTGQKNSKSNETKSTSKTPGKVSKKSLVLSMFDIVGDAYSVSELLEYSGFDLRNFKTFINIMKNPNKTKPEDIRVFRIEGDLVTWME